MSKKNKKILIVDDDSDFANVSQMVLNEYGYDVYWSKNGEEAIDFIDNQNINLILMDIDLGNELDGIETSKIILNKHDVPIIFLSYHSELAYFKKIENILNYGYVVKSSPLIILLNSIRVALELFETKISNQKIINELSTKNIQISNMENKLQKSHKRIFQVIENISALVYVIDIKTYEILFINKYVRNLFGDIVGKKCWQTIQTTENGPCSFCKNSKLFDEKGKSTGVFTWEKKNTVNGKWYECRGRIIEWEDDRKAKIEIATDITDRKECKDRLLKQNKQLQEAKVEIEILLNEIHHRVKNNFYIIQSILSLQKDYTNNEGTNIILDECIDRIRSMSLLHQSLYQMDNLSKIDMQFYIQDIISHLHSCYDKIETVIRIYNKTDKIYLDLKRSVPIGLIINEIITNALKYAFKDRETGKISISFKENNDKYELRIKDDGIGLPENISISLDVNKKPESYGTFLISIFIQQLRAELEIIRNSGTEFVIIFDK
jgi:two-component sensor histidine kinase/DNA-binding response OmpR family regulator